MLEFEDLMQLKADKAVLAIIFFKNVVTGEIKLHLGDDWSWIVYHRFANVDNFGGFEQSSNYSVT
jgi:hypothetical protein